MQNPMSYEKAMSVFNKYDSQYSKEGEILFKILITPSKESDFIQYLNRIRAMPGLAENETAIRFSSDGMFILRKIAIDRGDAIIKSI